MKISIFLVLLCYFTQKTQAQNHERIDSLYQEYTWYVNTIDHKVNSCGTFFIIEDNQICENLDRLEDYFFFFRKRSEVTIEIYKEFLKIEKPSKKLILESDSTIKYHKDGIHLIDSVLFIFYEKCSF